MWASNLIDELIFHAPGRVNPQTAPALDCFGTNPAVDSLFLFTARPYDPDSQLQNNLNRWYDARVGRWLSEDPIGFAGGDGNLYRYVGNGPGVSRDWQGLEDIEFLGTVIVYPVPTGTFHVQIGTVAVVDPAQQKWLGEHTTGYTIKYQAPRGACDRDCDRIILTQAVAAPGFFSGTLPHFDAERDPLNADLVYPEYTGQKPRGPGSLADAPYNPRSTEAVTWELTVCAICTTTLYDRANRYKIVVQVLLGCIAFEWRDRNPPALIKAGQSLAINGQQTVFPAECPSELWHDALNRRSRKATIR